MNTNTPGHISPDEERDLNAAWQSVDAHGSLYYKQDASPEQFAKALTWLAEEATALAELVKAEADNAPSHDFVSDAEGKPYPGGGFDFDEETARDLIGAVITGTRATDYKIYVRFAHIPHKYAHGASECIGMYSDIAAARNHANRLSKKYTIPVVHIAHHSDVWKTFDTYRGDLAAPTYVNPEATAQQTAKQTAKQVIGVVLEGVEKRGYSVYLRYSDDTSFCIYHTTDMQDAYAERNRIAQEYTVPCARVMKPDDVSKTFLPTIHAQAEQVQA